MKNGTSLCMITSMLLTASLHAAPVSIAWLPPTNAATVAGYQVHAGMASRDYTQHYAIGNVTEWTMDFDASTTWYFAITATNRYGAASVYSTELVWDNLAPTLLGPASLTLTLPDGAPLLLPDFLSLVSATDDFSLPPDIMLSQVPPAGSPLVQGILVSWLAVDEAGNIGRLDRVLAVTIQLTEPVSAVSGEADGKALQINKGAK